MVLVFIGSINFLLLQQSGKFKVLQISQAQFNQFNFPMLGPVWHSAQNLQSRLGLQQLQLCWSCDQWRISIDWAEIFRLRHGLSRNSMNKVNFLVSPIPLNNRIWIFLPFTTSTHNNCDYRSCIPFVFHLYSCLCFKWVLVGVLQSIMCII